MTGDPETDATFVAFEWTTFLKREMLKFNFCNETSAERGTRGKKEGD